MTGISRNYVLVDGVWVPQIQSLGFSDRIHEEWNSTNLSAGTNNLDSDPVPADTWWVITNIMMVYFGTVPSSMTMGMYDGSIYHEWIQELSVTSGKYYDRQGYWLLKAGDVVRYAVYGATSTDDATLRAYGYSIDA